MLGTLFAIPENSGNLRQTKKKITVSFTEKTREMTTVCHIFFLVTDISNFAKNLNQI